MYLDWNQNNLKVMTGCVISERIHNYNDKSLRVISNLERYIVICPDLYHDDALRVFFNTIRERIF